MSNYAVMSEINGRTNRSRQVNRLPVQYLKSVLVSLAAYDEDKVMAQRGLDTIEAFDKLLSNAYVSTGFQYDDEACDRVEREDRYWDTLEQRCGSTAAEEAEAEITHHIAHKRAGEAMDEVIAYFTAEVTARLFPSATTEVHNGESYEVRSEYWEFPRRYYGGREIGELRAMSLSEWVEAGRDALQEGWDEERHGGHGDY
jgi:hypothetical protein